MSTPDADCHGPMYTVYNDSELAQIHAEVDDLDACRLQRFRICTAVLEFRAWREIFCQK